MNRTKMSPGQDPDEFLYIMDSGRNRLNTNTPTEGLRDWQDEDFLLQALSPDYESIRRAHLERRDFGLADNRRMMAAIYADNLSRRSIISAGIAGPGAPTKRGIETFTTSSATNAQCLAITGGIIPTAANSSIKADNTSTQRTTAHARLAATEELR